MDSAVLERSAPIGRHRNKARAAQHRARAVELAVAGHTYQQIADALGYANRGTVHRIVQQALSNQVVEGVEHLRRAQLEQLDRQQAALWSRAMQGHVESNLALLRIHDARCRLLGLYETTAARCRQVPTVVLRKDDCRLRGCPEHS